MARTQTIKNLDEVYAYAVGESQSMHFATLVVTAADTLEIRLGDGYSSGNTSDLVLFPKYGIPAGGASGTIQCGGAADNFVYAAELRANGGSIVETPEAITGGDYFAITGGEQGQVFEAYIKPTYTSSHEIDWLTACSMDEIETKRDIKKRGRFDHRKRMFNVDRNLSVTQLYTHAKDNLLKFAGIDFDLIMERQDDDAGITTETIFVWNCFHEAGLPNESIGDNDSDISLSMGFEQWATVDGDGS